MTSTLQYAVVGNGSIVGPTTPSPTAADSAASSAELDGKEKLEPPRHWGRRIV